MSPSDAAISPAESPRKLRVMVLGLGAKPSVAAEAERLRAALEQATTIVAWDLGFGEDLSRIDADLAVVLGGDGSILRAAHQMGYNQRPVIGVNLGKLGFLAALSPEQFLATLPDLAAGRYRVIQHLMFECRLERDGQRIWCELGLNEAAVLSAPPFAMLRADLYVDGELVTTYSCDGLIISTPVGSTAHSLSAGGPILRKDIEAFVVVPLSPHTLTNRPVVDAASRVFEVRTGPTDSGATVVVDGQVLGPLHPGDRLSVRRAEACFKLIEMPGHSYYRTLREKLGWGGSLSLNDRS
jgi:NAD+ kinase